MRGMRFYESREGVVRSFFFRIQGVKIFLKSRAGGGFNMGEGGAGL